MYIGPNSSRYCKDIIDEEHLPHHLTVTGDGHSTERVFLDPHGFLALMTWPKLPFTLYL